MKQLKHSNQSFEQEARGRRQKVRQLEDKMRMMIDREQLQQLKRDHQVTDCQKLMQVSLTQICIFILIDHALVA